MKSDSQPDPRQANGHSDPGVAPYGSAETRLKILDAARTIFAGRGFVDATIDDIVTRCEVSRGTFYYCFKNKGDVFEALVRMSCSELLEQTKILPASDDPFTRIEARNLGYLRVFAAYKDIFRNLFQVATIEPRFAALQHELRMSFLMPIQKSLERNLQAGRISKLNPRIVAFGLGGMLDWFAYVWLGLDLLDDPRVTIEEAAHELSELWYHAIYGSRRHPGCTREPLGGR